MRKEKPAGHTVRTSVCCVKKPQIFAALNGVVVAHSGHVSVGVSWGLGSQVLRDPRLRFERCQPCASVEIAQEALALAGEPCARRPGFTGSWLIGQNQSRDRTVARKLGSASCHVSRWAALPMLGPLCPGFSLIRVCVSFPASWVHVVGTPPPIMPPTHLFPLGPVCPVIL